MKSGTIYTFIMLICLQTVNAQSFSEALLKANQSFTAYDSVAYDIQYASFGMDGNDVSSEKFHFEKIGDLTLTLSDDIKAYTNEELNLIVDESEKTLLLNVGIELEDGSSNLEKQLELLRVIEKEAKKVEKKETDHTTNYILHFDDFQFEKIFLQINRNTSLLDKIAFFLTEPLIDPKEPQGKALNGFHITIDNYTMGIDAFSTPISEYIEKKEDKYYPTDKYTNYQFVNNYE